MKNEIFIIDSFLVWVMPSSKRGFFMSWWLCVSGKNIQNCAGVKWSANRLAQHTENPWVLIDSPNILRMKYLTQSSTLTKETYILDGYHRNQTLHKWYSLHSNKSAFIFCSWYIQNPEWRNPYHFLRSLEVKWWNTASCYSQISGHCWQCKQTG